MLSVKKPLRASHYRTSNTTLFSLKYRSDIVRLFRGMDLLRTCCALLIVRFASGAQYIIRVDQYSFVPVDRELVIGQGSVIEQEGNRSYVSGHLMFSRDVHEVTMFASLDMLRPKSRRVRLFENKLEFCTFSANAYKSKFLRQLYNNYVSYINTPPICPLKAVSIDGVFDNNRLFLIMILFRTELQLYPKSRLCRRTFSTRFSTRVQLHHESPFSAQIKTHG